MRVSNFPITNFVNGDMSSSITSPEISVYQVYGWSSQFVFTGAPVGAIKVQMSDDPYQPEGNITPTNWTDITSSTVSITAAGDASYNYTGSFYNWIRFIYTSTSGTGTINGRMNIKGV